MPKLILVCLVAGLLTACRTSAQVAEPALCEVGSSVVDAMYLQSTGTSTRIDPTLLRASILFLEECPASVIPAFRQFADRGFTDHASELRHAWIEALRSAVQDSSNTDLRALLVAAEVRIARVSDQSLNEYLDGIFEGSSDNRAAGQRALEPLFERQALAILQEYAQCDGAGCFDASDNVLFFLATHPVAFFKAMHADSVHAANWLREVADESFAGISERGASREAARNALLKKLSETEAPEYERERRACEGTLRGIRYREVQ